MRILSRRRLREFWEQPGRLDSETSLKTWYDVASHASWTSHNDVKSSYGANVDLAYGLYVFDIRGNRYRLICDIAFERQTVFTLRVCTHADCDKLCENGGKRLRELKDSFDGH